MDPIKVAKFVMGGAAVVASFLLIQTSVPLGPIVQVALGAFLAFAAYADPASLVSKREID